MKMSELRDRNNEELLRSLDEAHRELFNLRFQAASGQLADVHRARAVRKDIARMKTVLKERQMLAAASEEQ
ncbi:MAG: 50S ribosomal protein L29 [Dehalococcoidia bacterium]|nr:50S ribosomal protein L29 [Dehalococcoidia bacterium]